MDGDTTSPTPFTPPTTEEDRLAWLRLIRSPKVGPATFLRLLAAHGSASAALASLRPWAEANGHGDYRPCSAEAADREYHRGFRIGAEPLYLGAADYPPQLAMLADPPPFLWALGRGHSLPLRPSVAVIGARDCSSLGLRMARDLARSLATEGIVVVSGLARGIDTAAHGAALTVAAQGGSSGGTIAVMPGGVDVIYPPENAGLAAAIADQGLRISEQPMGFEPQARHFPRRNRIISGLSLAVVVVEAAEGSGSLITTREALEQGREVLAVPGHPLDPRAAGANRLIREGATLIRNARDLLEALATQLPNRTRHPLLSGPGAPAPTWRLAPRARLHVVPAQANRAAPEDPSSTTTGHLPLARSPSAAPADDVNARILRALGSGPIAEDALMRSLGLPASRVVPALVILELAGRLQRGAGGMVSRC